MHNNMAKGKKINHVIPCFSLWVLFVLTVIVFIHEYGNFWAARRSGVYVEVFSIGFGQELFGWNDRYGTRWQFSAIHWGYVRMRGDKDPSGIPDANAARKKEVSWWHHWLVVRLLFPWDQLPISFLVYHIRHRFYDDGQAFSAVIDELVEGSAAEQQGWK